MKPSPSYSPLGVLCVAFALSLVLALDAAAQTVTIAPPKLSKFFGATTLPVNGTTALQFVVSNPNSGVALTGIGFTDTLPTGLKVAATPNVQDGCGGTISATPGSSVLTLTGGTVASNGACTMEVNVTATATGTLTNTTGPIFCNQTSLTGSPATAPLIVTPPPTEPPKVSETFAVTSITVNGTTTLQFTVSNPNSGVALTGVGFTDTLPTGLNLASTPDVQDGCSGTISATPGSSVLTLTGGTVAANGSCSIQVSVTASALGTITNTTGFIFCNQTSLPGSPATAMLIVTSPPSFTLGLPKSSNPYVPFGVDTEDIALNTPGLLPSPDAIQEFNLISSTINPEYGRNSGGIVNALIKSGTNFFDASAFDFYRDTFLNDRNFFTVGPQQPIFHQNTFGGTFGGPLFKDKTFLFLSYQGTYNNFTSNPFTTAPFGPATQITDNFTKIIGKHTLKFGFDARRFHVDDPFFATAFFPAAAVNAHGTGPNQGGLNEARVSFNRLNVDFGGAAVGANPNTGNEVVTLPGLSAQGSGSRYPLRVYPVYNSQSNSTGFFGSKMSSILDMSLNVSPTAGAILQDWDGQIRSYSCPPGATTCFSTVPGDASAVTLDFVHGHTVSYADKWKIHFGLDGRISDGGDGRGYNFQFTRSPSAIKLTDNLGAEIDAALGSDGLVSALSDLSGRSLQLNYSISQKLTLEIGPNGGRWNFSYNSAGDMTGIGDPNNNQTSVGFNTSHGVTSITDAASHTIKFNLGSSSTGVTDPLNNQWTVNFDTFFRTMGVKNPLGGMRSRTFDSMGFPNSLKDENSNTWSFLNNSAGYPLKETNPLGDSASATYDANNNQKSSTDFNGNTYTNTFDSNNNLTDTLNPLGGTHKYFYDSLGRVVQEIDENGVVTTYAYDDTAHTVTTTFAAGTPLSLTFVSHFDPIGRNIETDYPGGRIDTTQWSPLSLPVQFNQVVGTSLQRSFQRQYDLNGNAIGITNFRGIQTKVQYDARNLPIRIDLGFGLLEVQTEIRAYDANRNLTQDTIGGFTADNLFDASGRLIKTSLGNGKTFSRTLDLVGNTLSTTDGNGDINTVQYDALNRPNHASLFDGNVLTFTFDKNSNILTETDKNSSTNNLYDVLDRPTSSVFSDLTNGTTTPISDQYDAVGNVIRINLPDSTATQYFYDGFDRPTKVIDRTGLTLFTYNSAGFLANKTLSNGVATDFLYDALGRTISLQNFHGSTPLSSQSVIYDPNDNVIQFASFAGGVTHSQYDGFDRLVKFTAANGSATTYAYDGVGDRTSVTNSLGTTDDSYDSAGWLIHDGTHTLANDGNGNLLSDGTFTNTYNPFGWLASSSNGTFTDHFLYTPKGFRFFKQDSKGNHRSFYDPATGQRLFETTTNGTTTSTTFFTWVPGGPLISAQNPTQTFFYVQDIFHNSMTVTGSTGGILANYTFTLFGQPTNVTDPLRNVNEYYFNGQEKDQDTQLIYFRFLNGYYNPNRGRFNDQRTYQSSLDHIVLDVSGYFAP